MSDSFELSMAESPEPGKTDENDLGTVFVNDYPPQSAWRNKHVPEAMKVLSSPFESQSESNTTADFNAALCLYLHIPFAANGVNFVISASIRTRTAHRSRHTSMLWVRRSSFIAKCQGLRGAH